MLSQDLPLDPTPSCDVCTASTLKGEETDEIERELFHQLLHIGQDDKQRWELAQHEAEAFYSLLNDLIS